MPCSRPSTSVPRYRRLPSLRMSPPRIVAKLDLSKDGERRTHDFLLRVSTGRWPLWRIFAVRKLDSSLAVVVEWLRMACEDRYSLVGLSFDPVAMSWQDFRSLSAARLALAALSTDAQPEPMLVRAGEC